MSETPSSERTIPNTPSKIDASESTQSEIDTTKSNTSEFVTPETLKPILKIQSRDGDINIIAKFRGEVTIKPINLKLIIATLWWEKTGLETFFNILELTIKRALNEVYPHNKLVMNYHYSANDYLEDASEIVVEIDDLKADATEVKVEGDSIVLMGNDDRGFFKKITSFRRKITEEIHKEI